MDENKRKIKRLRQLLEESQTADCNRPATQSWSEAPGHSAIRVGSEAAVLNTTRKPPMQRSVLQTRINEARNLSHNESREQILSSIREELQPVVDAMDTAIGRKAQGMYADPSVSPYSFDEDGNPDSNVLLSYENGFTGEAMHINTIVVDDVYELVRVRNLITKLKLTEAYEKAQTLDTAVREYIPDEVWDFFRS